MLKTVIKWICENPECNTHYAEYVNGCPRCWSNGGLKFSVKAKEVVDEVAELERIINL